MRKSGMLVMVLAGAMSLGACTHDPYSGTERTVRDAAVGAAVGAAGGAAVGAVVDGVSTGEGAAAGAIAGAVVGAVASDDNRRWYRDQYGRCYYVNDRGDRIYDDERRC